MEFIFENWICSVLVRKQNTFNAVSVDWNNTKKYFKRKVKEQKWKANIKIHQTNKTMKIYFQ